MDLRPCLLSDENTMVCAGVALGGRVAVNGHRALWGERGECGIDTVVLHYISALESNPGEPFAIDAILQIYCELGVSAHYMICRDGVVWQLVPEEKKAWHCGPSIMPHPDNRTGVNAFSLGVELVATAASGYTPRQYAALDELVSLLVSRYGPGLRFVGHSDIAGSRAVELGLRTVPKTDPGPLFDWGQLQASVSRTAGGG